MKIRKFPESNYSALFINNKTIRVAIDSKKPIIEIEYPEFYDISMGNKCETGKCSYCYASGNAKGVHYSNITEKLYKLFGNLTENQRPLQVAIGGQQEPLEHPEFLSAMKTFVDLGILPNYTTNGVLIQEDEKLEAIKKYSGGVALTLHKHLSKHWDRALELFKKHSIRSNIHVIISDDDSIRDFAELYKKYHNMVEYFVLLPWMNVGFAARNPKKINLDLFEKTLDEVVSDCKIAFGANFYDFLVKTKKYKVSLYPPEIFSKYLILDDELKVRNNSFEQRIVNWNKEKLTWE